MEYITKPEKDYKFLYEKLITPRKKLRRWLKNKDLTIIPSSTFVLNTIVNFKDLIWIILSSIYTR
ncbi:MAG: hypothetical protein Ct9H90mP6_12150 [Gammaproteobacteria bacterium]|nr:MAG: hypothetical protein Ct9H90mP6_12150 [Gammaproteobacteria bacterium]